MLASPSQHLCEHSCPHEYSNELSSWMRPHFPLLLPLFLFLPLLLLSSTHLYRFVSCLSLSLSPPLPAPPSLLSPRTELKIARDGVKSKRKLLGGGARLVFREMWKWRSLPLLTSCHYALEMLIISFFYSEEWNFFHSVFKWVFFDNYWQSSFCLLCSFYTLKLKFQNCFFWFIDL